MTHPFFDAVTYPWSRPEAGALFDLLTITITNPQEIALIYQRSGGSLASLDTNQAPGLIWTDALNLLSTGGLLSDFCAQLEAIARLKKNKAFQQAIRDVVGEATSATPSESSVASHSGVPARAPGIFHEPPAGWVSNARRNRLRYKVVALDLDGTLLRGDDFVFSWEAIWKYLGFGDTVQRDLRREYRRRSGANASPDERIAAYTEWCEKACAMFRKRELTRTQLKELSTQLHLTANCREALTRLRTAGFTIAIVSGGVNTFLEDAFDDFRDYVDFVFINQLTFAGDGALEGVVATAYDFEGKADALEHVCDRAGCSASEAVFVGDHHNDESVMLRAGLAIAYPSHDQLVTDASQERFENDDLLDILPKVLVE